MSRKNAIMLTEEKLKSLKVENFLAITIAEIGAMGDPGAIEFIDDKLNLYCTHFGEMSDSLLEEKIPFLKTVQIMFGSIKNLSDDWAGIYTGYGNYLFVRPEYKDGIINYIKDKYDDISVSSLYIHWYEALQAVVKK